MNNIHVKIEFPDDTIKEYEIIDLPHIIIFDKPVTFNNNDVITITYEITNGETRNETNSL